MRAVALVALAMLAFAPVAAAASSGKTLFAGACAKCHGAAAEGIPAKGPPLRGVGAIAADFYLRTGYMPLSDPHAQPRRSRSPFAPERLDALVAYIASFGGPGIPRPHPEGGSLSDGLRLFTEYCAGCHQVVAEGGVVTDSIAPSLQNATTTEIAEAVRIGPYVMPAFPSGQISERDLDSIIRYVQYAKSPDDRGGWAIGHLGPIPEGMVAWLIAGSALVVVALLIAGRRRQEEEE